MITARNKMKTIDDAAKAIRLAQRRGERVVFTNGCFDLLHVGHIRSFEAAKRLGDRLVVAINNDASVRRLKGLARPIQPAATRKEVVAALACVDWVVGFSANTPLRTLKRLRPDILAKGGDWKLDKIVGREEVESWGGRVARLKIVAGHSTTDTLRKIEASTRKKR